MKNLSLTFKLTGTIEAELLEEPELLEGPESLDDRGKCEGAWEYGGELTLSIDGAEDSEEYAAVPLRDFIPVLDTSIVWGESPVDHIAKMRGIADSFHNLAEELRHKAQEYESRLKT